MQQQIEQMIREAIGAVLGADACQSQARQEELAKQAAQAILEMLRPAKCKAA